MYRIRSAALILVVLSFSAGAVQGEEDAQQFFTGLRLSFGNARLTGSSFEHLSGDGSDDGGVSTVYPGIGLRVYGRRELARYLSLGSFIGVRSAGMYFTQSETLPGELEEGKRTGRYRTGFVETGLLVSVSTESRPSVYVELLPGLRVLPGTLQYEEQYEVGDDIVRTQGRTRPLNRFAFMLEAAVGMTPFSGDVAIDFGLGFSIYSQEHRKPPGPDGYRPDITELRIGVEYAW